jgi:hypothetical protein
MTAKLAFRSRTTNVLTALASICALLALIAYVAAPVSAKPAMSAKPVAAGTAAAPQVSGVVNSAGGPLANALVLVRVRDAAGNVLIRAHVRTDARGRFSVTLPAGADHLRVIVAAPGGRTATNVFGVAPGQSLAVTTVFPARRSALLPGVFAY